jgi:hypothetical protein
MSPPLLRPRPALVAALAALLVLAFGPPVANAGSSTTFSGRATVIKGTLPVVGSVNIVDTGELPSSGGAAHSCLLAYPTSPDCSLQTVPDQTNGAISAEVLGARTVGQGSHSHASSSAVSLSVDLAKLTGVSGLPTLTASFLDAEANAVCQNGVATASGASQVLDVVVGGTSVDPLLQPSVSVGGVVTIYFNQVSTGPNGSGGQQADVKTLEIVGPLGTDLVIGYAHADITCGSAGVPQGGCSTKLTGGGWYQPPTTGKTAHFALAASGSDPSWGHLVYSNDATGLKFHGRPDGAVLFGPGQLSDTQYSKGPTNSIVQGAAIIHGTNAQPFTFGGTTYDIGQATFVAAAIDNGEGHNAPGDVVGIVIFGKSGNMIDHAGADGSGGILTSLDGVRLGGGNVQYHDCR